MTKAKKVEILYSKAKGRNYSITKEEEQELRPYKVDFNEGSFYSTRANITNYVTAVDNGSRLPFYDWCMNNTRADNRRRGSSKKAMKGRNKEKAFSAVCIGWLTWGIALYWMFEEQLSVAMCAVMGAAISFFLIRVGRKNAGWTIIVLPVVLLLVFGPK